MKEDEERRVVVFFYGLFMDESLLRAPALGDLRRLLEAGRGTVRQVTLAPELPGGLEMIRAPRSHSLAFVARRSTIRFS